MTRSLPLTQIPARQAPANVSDKGAILWVKRGIFLYFWFLILEGALRKWVLPQLSAPLLIVRDPVVIFIYWQAFRSGKLKSSEFVPLAALSMVATFLAAAQIALGENDFLTAVFGLRSYFLHLPLIYVMKQVLTLADIRKIGRWILSIALPMALLMLAQFRSPSNSWLNKGAGEGSLQLAFAGEHIRAAGTFSYTMGISDFFPLVTAFLLFAIMDGGYPKLLVIAAAIANVFALPTAGSRTLMILTMLVVIVALLTNSTSVRSFARLSKAGAIIVVAGLIASQTPMFKDASDAFTERWNSANEQEGGENGLQGAMGARILAPILEPFEESSNVAWLGRGIGLGSNFASTIKAGGSSLSGGATDEGTDFLLAESEWPRVIQEFGPLIGLLFMGFRIYLSASLIYLAFRASRAGSSLALLIASSAIPLLATGVMEQATNLGFIVFGTGLAFAAVPLKARGMPILSFSATSRPARLGTTL